nr:MAG TPA: hypothetical protein [Caudoviricetes sp.]
MSVVGFFILSKKYFYKEKIQGLKKLIISLPVM